MSLGRFTFIYVVFGLIIAGLALLLVPMFEPREILAKNFWAAFIFLFVLTYIAYGISDFGVRKTPQAGVVALMGGLILKLLFAMAFAVLIIVKTSVNQVVFALNYFSLYLLFTCFEVMCLLRNLRDQNKK